MKINLQNIYDNLKEIKFNNCDFHILQAVSFEKNKANECKLRELKNVLEISKTRFDYDTLMTYIDKQYYMAVSEETGCLDIYYADIESKTFTFVREIPTNFSNKTIFMMEVVKDIMEILM